MAQRQENMVPVLVPVPERRRLCAQLFFCPRINNKNVSAMVKVRGHSLHVTCDLSTCGGSGQSEEITRGVSRSRRSRSKRECVFIKANAGQKTVNGQNSRRTLGACWRLSRTYQENPVHTVTNCKLDGRDCTLKVT